VFSPPFLPAVPRCPGIGPKNTAKKSAKNPPKNPNEVYFLILHLSYILKCIAFQRKSQCPLCGFAARFLQVILHLSHILYFLRGHLCVVQLQFVFSRESLCKTSLVPGRKKRYNKPCQYSFSQHFPSPCILKQPGTCPRRAGEGKGKRAIKSDLDKGENDHGKSIQF
jgi:hypothetical protein